MEKTEKEKPAPVVALPDFINAFQIFEMRLGCNKTQPEALIEIIYESIHTRFPDRGLKMFKETMERYISNKLEVKPNIELYGHPPLGEPLIFSCLSEVNAKEAARERERHVLENNSFDVEKKEMEIDVAVNLVNELLSSYQKENDTSLRWVFWKEAFRLLYKKGIIFDYVSGSVDFETGDVLNAKEVCERAALRAQKTYLDDLKWRAGTDKDLKNELFIIQHSPEELRRAASIPAIRLICDLIIENTKTIKQ